MKRCIPLLLLFMLPVIGYTQDVPKDVLAHVRAASVSIVWEGRVIGSGTVFHSGEEAWVLTAKHCIHPGNWRTAGLVVAQQRKDGRVIGIAVDEVEMSDKDDIAWLRVCPKLFPVSARPCQDVVELDTAIVHCGSMARQHQTVTRGYVVGHRSEDNGWPCYQLDVTAQGGSSGGGVFLAKTGEFVGFVHVGIAPHVIFSIPTRRIPGLERKMSFVN